MEGPRRIQSKGGRRGGIERCCACGQAERAFEVRVEIYLRPESELRSYVQKNWSCTVQPSCK